MRQHTQRLAQVVKGRPIGAALVWSSLALTTASVSTVILARPWLTALERATLLTTSVVSWAALVALGWTRGRLPVGPILVAIVATMGAAISTPSYQSNDIYSYAMYGRIFTEHHRSPYETYPAHFEADPMRRHVAEMWQRTPDVYGIAFTGMAVALAPVIGESPFLARFVYQAIAAAAVAAILWMLWRRTRNMTVLAFVGLHPLLAVSVVNGGHNDALMALGVLVGALLLLQRRPALAALALAFATSIKISAIPVVIVLAIWVARTWSPIVAAKIAAIVAVFGALPYLLVEGWVDTLHAQSRMISRTSLWNALGTFAIKNAGGPFGTGWLTHHEFRDVAARGMMIALGVMLVVIVLRHTARPTPELAAAAVIAAFFVASPWVMPWYAFAALPLLALRRPNVLTWLVAFDATIVLIGDQFPSLAQGAIGGLWHQLLQLWIPIVATAVCVVAIARRTQATPAVLRA